MSVKIVKDETGPHTHICNDCETEWTHNSPHTDEGENKVTKEQVIELHKCPKCGAPQFFNGKAPDKDISRALNQFFLMNIKGERLPDPKEFIKMVPEEKHPELLAAISELGVAMGFINPEVAKMAGILAKLAALPPELRNLLGALLDDETEVKMEVIHARSKEELQAKIAEVEARRGGRPSGTRLH